MRLFESDINRLKAVLCKEEPKTAEQLIAESMAWVEQWEQWKADHDRYQD